MKPTARPSRRLAILVLAPLIGIGLMSVGCHSDHGDDHHDFHRDDHHDMDHHDDHDDHMDDHH